MFPLAYTDWRCDYPLARPDDTFGNAEFFLKKLSTERSWAAGLLSFEDVTRRRLFLGQVLADIKAEVTCRPMISGAYTVSRGSEAISDNLTNDSNKEAAKPYSSHPSLTSQPV